ncbi:hypothetical protein TeGR_g13533, partial [Tetraparma gracilis]
YFAFVDGSDDQGGHGTHVVGSIVGRRSTNGRVNGETSTLGEEGMAYDAKVAFYDIGITNGGLQTPYDLSEIFDNGYAAGARIHSASWGSDSNAYGYSDVDFDEYMHSHDDFLSLVAAGNSGDDGTTFNKPGTVGTPATAKNILSVGASQGGPGRLNGGMLGFEYLASFSSRGPTADGRTKPDIIAPGYFIKSASADMNTVGGSDETFMAGTSMATPVAAGTAALVRDYFMQGFYPTGSRLSSNAMTPSGALVKAVMISSARPLAGSQNDDASKTVVNINEYDANQNFGRLQLNRAVSLTSDPETDFSMYVSDDKSLSQSRSEVFEFTIDKQSGCSSNDFVMTLVWTDPVAARGCTKCVLNDLDLSVTRTSTGGTFYPNGRSSRDSTNNAERVRFTSVTHGEKITATVNARSLSVGSKQKFAFVAVGCIGEEQDETPSPTTAIATEVIVPSSIILRGCSMYGYTETDAAILREALDKALAPILSLDHVCDIEVMTATSSFTNPDPIPMPDFGERRLAEAVAVNFKVTAELGGSGYSTAQALHNQIRLALDTNVKNTILEQWINALAGREGGGLCSRTADIDESSYVSPGVSDYTTQANLWNNRYCKGWSYTVPSSPSPTPSPTPRPATPSPTPAPTADDSTRSPTRAPTYSPTQSPTSSPTKNPTPSPSPAPTPRPTTPAPTVATCSNGGLDWGETDVDCGGPFCPSCDAGKQCDRTGDCKGNMQCNGNSVCEVPPTPSPTIAPTISPTPEPTWRVTILDFTMIFRIDGVSIASGLFGDKQLGALVDVLNKLLGKSGSDYSVVVKSDFHGDWSDCVDTCRQTVGYMGVCGDVENLFNCVANSCPDEKQVFSESLEGVLLNDCYCEGDSDSCQEISMIERGAGARRSLGEWPPPSSEALNGACNANEVEIFVDMTDSYADGWNNAIATVTDAAGAKQGNSFTCAGGSSTHALCLVPACYDLDVTSGEYPTEIGWKVRNGEGTVLLERARPDASPFDGSFCVPSLAPTGAPTPAPSVLPHLALAVVGQVEMDEFALDYRESMDVFKDVRSRLSEAVASGDLDKELRKKGGWESIWTVSEEEFVPPQDYVEGVKIYDERPDGGDGGGDGGGGFDVKGFFEDYGIIIGGGVGGLLVVVLLVVGISKLRAGSGGGGGGARHGGNLHGGAAKRGSRYGGGAAAPAPRRASKRPSGVNFGAAAAKGVKHHGAPAYGKQFQMV